MLHITVREPCEANELVSHHLSPENVDAVFDAGLVWVSGARVSDPKKTLAAGTVLELRIPEEVYSHKGILVINKPSGLPSQPTRTQQDNLYTQLCALHPYVGLHHRLDTPASGLLLFCTDKRWNPSLSRAFQSHRIVRQYWVALLGLVPEKGQWNRSIDGKSARTNFQRMAHHDDISIVTVTLETGRKHQIRRHASMAGFPILGDRRYGGLAGKLHPRLALHAQKIQFQHPATRQKVTSEASLPTDLHSLLSR